ncbi:hypothetical protein X560_0880 [Listeria fleischmannii 1991]|uniref:Viral enhancin protein n=2 Tax=Listeria fleischmannii TaxID=1069827 RepID=A0A2X3GQG5_9LIST|nr:putative mucin/carbohydrate-binding domain-containing protein [Listeria fleischmannii]EMG26663.1 enhancin family protein [Listeria fleischmannii subsp. fleischmannii LU2006-1]KMT60374.1 hypothetical protein X560_0880 [Listeria fleischmannii 1991]SQC70422.1 Viral enhancin protein [Listeria fleischmannii subsp. fleischmannii]
MKKIVFCCVFLLILCGVGGSLKASAKEVTEKEVFSLPWPTYIANSGMSKGRYHDRQDLGFVLQAKDVLRVRQTNPEFTDKLTVRLLGNDNWKEKSVQVGTDWVEVSAEDNLVPFVDTPYGDAKAKIEYEVIGANSEPVLPVYEYKGSEQNFFATWDEGDAEYALIKDKNFQLLIPKESKEAVRNLEDYDSMDELIQHYTEIFSEYNAWVGLDNIEPENVNSENRYFLKADLHGAGAAYYGSYWTAQTYTDVSMWLSKSNWGVLHEIAHGYQAGFDGVGMYTGEVSNNLFGVKYEYEHYGKEADQIGWLFDYGDKEHVEENFYNAVIRNDKPYRDLDLRQQLLILTMLREKAGMDAYTKMYQDYRKIASEPGYKKNDYPLSDLMNKYYSEMSHQDFTSVLENRYLALDEHQSEKNRANGYPAVAALAEVVPEDQLDRARALLDPSLLITSNFELVQNKEIAPLNLKGNLTLQFKNDENTNIESSKVTLKDGNKEVATEEIQNNTAQFKNIPNGVYSLEFSGENTKTVVSSKNYVYVKEAQNDVDINLSQSDTLLNQEITFLGLNDVPFATLKNYPQEQSATFDIFNETPHSYFDGKEYARVTLYDNNGVKQYDKSIEGTHAIVGEDILNLPLLDGEHTNTLVIYHAEANGRLVTDDDLLNTNSNSKVLIPSKWGFENPYTNPNAYDALINRVDNKGTKLLNEDSQLHVPFAISVDKKELYATIQLLKEPEKIKFMDKFSSLFV